MAHKILFCVTLAVVIVLVTVPVDVSITYTRLAVLFDVNNLASSLEIAKPRQFVVMVLAIAPLLVVMTLMPVPMATYNFESILLIAISPAVPPTLIVPVMPFVARSITLTLPETPVDAYKVFVDSDIIRSLGTSPRLISAVTVLVFVFITAILLLSIAVYT
jgi:hypothetical protein